MAFIQIGPASSPQEAAFAIAQRGDVRFRKLVRVKDQPDGQDYSLAVLLQRQSARLAFEENATEGTLERPDHARQGGWFRPSLLAAA